MLSEVIFLKYYFDYANLTFKNLYILVPVRRKIKPVQDSIEAVWNCGNDINFSSDRPDLTCHLCHILCVCNLEQVASLNFHFLGSVYRWPSYVNWGSCSMLHRAVERIITSSTPHPRKHIGFLSSLQNLHNLTPVQCFKPLLHQSFCFLNMLCICVLIPMWFSFCTLSPLARLIALYVYSNRFFKICISIYYIAWSLS